MISLESGIRKGQSKRIEMATFPEETPRSDETSLPWSAPNSPPPERPAWGAPNSPPPRWRGPKSPPQKPSSAKNVRKSVITSAQSSKALSPSASPRAGLIRWSSFDDPPAHRTPNCKPGHGSEEPPLWKRTSEPIRAGALSPEEERRNQSAPVSPRGKEGKKSWTTEKQTGDAKRGLVKEPSMSGARILSPPPKRTLLHETEDLLWSELARRKNKGATPVRASGDPKRLTKVEERPRWNEPMWNRKAKQEKPSESPKKKYSKVRSLSKSPVRLLTSSSKKGAKRKSNDLEQPLLEANDSADGSLPKPDGSVAPAELTQLGSTVQVAIDSSFDLPVAKTPVPSVPFPDGCRVSNPGLITPAATEPAPGAPVSETGELECEEEIGLLDAEPAEESPTQIRQQRRVSSPGVQMQPDPRPMTSSGIRYENPLYDLTMTMSCDKMGDVISTAARAESKLETIDEGAREQGGIGRGGRPSSPGAGLSPESSVNKPEDSTDSATNWLTRGSPTPVKVNRSLSMDDETLLFGEEQGQGDDTWQQEEVEIGGHKLSVGDWLKMIEEAEKEGNGLGGLDGPDVLDKLFEGVRASVEVPAHGVSDVLPLSTVESSEVEEEGLLDEDAKNAKLNPQSQTNNQGEDPPPELAANPQAVQALTPATLDEEEVTGKSVKGSAPGNVPQIDEQQDFSGNENRAVCDLPSSEAETGTAQPAEEPGPSEEDCPAEVQPEEVDDEALGVGHVAEHVKGDVAGQVRAPIADGQVAESQENQTEELAGDESEGDAAAIWVKGREDQSKGILDGNPNGILEGSFDGNGDGVLDSEFGEDLDGSLDGNGNGVVDGKFGEDLDGSLDGNLTGSRDAEFDGNSDGSLEGEVGGILDRNLEGSQDVGSKIPLGDIVGSSDGGVGGSLDVNLDSDSDGSLDGKLRGSLDVNFDSSPDVKSDGNLGGSSNGNLDGNLDSHLEGSLHVSRAKNLSGGSDAKLEGSLELNPDGNLDAKSNGSLDGNPDGILDMTPDGNLDGNFNGSLDVNPTGDLDGSLDGNFDGNSEDVPESLGAEQGRWEDDVRFTEVVSLEVASNPKPKGPPPHAAIQIVKVGGILAQAAVKTGIGMSYITLQQCGILARMTTKVIVDDAKQVTGGFARFAGGLFGF